MLAFYIDFILGVGHVIGNFFGHVADVIIAAGSQPDGTDGQNGLSDKAIDPNGFVQGIRAFVGPILLLIVSLVAISFLFKRQLTQFFQFIALAVVIAVLFYVPGVIENIAGWLAGTLGGGGTT